MSEEAARKFFGNKSAIGETVDFGNSGIATFTISAVVKVPKTRTLHLIYLTRYQRIRFLAAFTISD